MGSTSENARAVDAASQCPHQVPVSLADAVEPTRAERRACDKAIRAAMEWYRQRKDEQKAAQTYARFTEPMGAIREYSMGDIES